MARPVPLLRGTGALRAVHRSGTCVARRFADAFLGHLAIKEDAILEPQSQIRPSLLVRADALNVFAPLKRERLPAGQGAGSPWTE
jgi:hypothetical protein